MQPPPSLYDLFPHRDRRALIYELARPSPPRLFAEFKQQPADPQLTDSNPCSAQASLVDDIFNGEACNSHVAARALIDRMLAHINADVPQPLCKDAQDVCDALRAATDEQCAAIVRGWSTLRCANAKLVSYSEVLTACLGCNTAPYLLGASESAKAAMYYMTKYSRHTSNSTATHIQHRTSQPR